MSPGEATTFWLNTIIGGFIAVFFVVYGALYMFWKANKPITSHQLNKFIPVNINGDTYLVDPSDPNAIEELRSLVNKPRGTDQYKGPGRDLSEFDESKEDYETKTAGAIDSRWFYSG